MFKKTSKKIITVLLALSFAAVFLPACDTSPDGKSDGKFTISFYSDDYADVVPPITELSGTPIEAPRAPERDGYRFGGWLLNGVLYDFTVMPAQNIRLYAQWDEACTITFDSKGGSAVEPILAVPGERIKPPDPPPRRPGYNFMGWLLDGAPFYFSVMPEYDLSLTADWTEAPASILPVVNVMMYDAAGKILPLPSSGRTAGDDQKRYVSSTVSVNAGDFGAGKGGVDAVPAGFRSRGYGSLFYGGAKKPYRIRFDDKQSVLGMPKSRHWVLISSHRNFMDNTMLIADTALSLAREVFDGFEYIPQSKLVDLYINNEYRGVYVLTEKYRVESGKVDIESEHGVLDTGYLMSVRWNWRGPGWAKFKPTDLDGRQIGRSPSGGDTYDLCVESPDYEDTTQSAFTPQMNFIKGEVSKLCDAMRKGDYNRFSELADVKSFVDILIFWDLYRNGDVAGGGFYLYKKPGGKFYAGTPWDFDNTFAGNANDLYNSTATTGGSANPFITYPWAMNEFKAEVRARWKVLSPLVKAKVPALWDPYIDDTGVQDAMVKNFVYWRNAPNSGPENYNGGPQNVSSWLNNARGKRDALVNRAGRLDTLFA